MRGIVKWTLVGSFLVAGPLTTMAQAPAPTPSTIPPRSPMFQQRTTLPSRPPLFSLFGIPVGIDAPVASPYCAGCAYDTFAGQPMRSRTAVAAEGMASGALSGR